MDDSKAYLIWGIIKALLIFTFRLIVLIPMVILTIIGAMFGAGEARIVDAIITCIVHPFSSLLEAIRNIKNEIDDYKNNM